MHLPKANGGWNGKTQQIYDGVVHRYSRRKDGTAVIYTVCCDCGLTHLEEFLPKRGYIRVRVWREEAITREVRRRRKRNRNRKRKCGGKGRK